MSTLDRGIRIITALVVGGLYLANIINGTLAIILGVVAVIFLLTGFVSFCPLYKALGLRTN